MTWRRFPRFFELAWEDREAGRCRLFMAKNCEGWPFDNACTFEDEAGELKDPYMNLDDADDFDLVPISQPHLQPGSACAIKAASIESCSRGVRFVSFWIKVITESGSAFFHTHDIGTTMASKLNETFTIQWE